MSLEIIIYMQRKASAHLQQKRIDYLGRIISKQGVDIDKAKIEAITNWSIPKNIKELRVF